MFAPDLAQPIDNGNGTITILSRFDDHFFPICLDKDTLDILAYDAEMPIDMLRRFIVSIDELKEGNIAFAYGEDSFRSSTLSITAIDGKNESWIILYSTENNMECEDESSFCIHKYKKIGYNYDFPKLNKYRKFDFPNCSKI
jgi:hypothetical protein